MEIIDDLPMKMNLEQYLTVLEKTVNFVSLHKNLADLNVCFGIYLINESCTCTNTFVLVNLRRTVQLKGRNLPLRKQVRLERLIKLNDEIIDYFAEKAVKHLEKHTDTEKGHIGLFHLYTNETTWPNNLPYFSMDLLKKTHYYSRKKLEALFFKWSLYLKNVYGVEDSQNPTPDDLDNCLNLLAQNPVNDNMGNIHCQVRFSCANFVLNGVHYGYGITHRVLFLLAARFSRRCVLTSVKEDKRLLDKLCSRMYNEAEFIANHDFGLPDLIMEQISLCALDGHGQFLRRSWIEELLDYQTAAGCFNLMRTDGNNSAIKVDNNTGWQYHVHDHMIFGGSCHTRSTAVGGSMIAAAISVFVTSVLAARVTRYTYKQVAIIHELPTDTDLDKYMRVLEKAMFFVNIHKYYVDMHLSFGIFLTNVNIRAMMKYRISEPVRTRLGHLLLNTEDILEYFYKTVLNHKKEHRMMLLPILSLYMNETMWLSKLRKFNTDLLNVTKYYFRKDLEDRFLKWPKYIESISGKREDPNPTNEEDCFNQLAQNPVNNNSEQAVCHLPFSCSNFIRHGSDHGYNMKNRLLMVIAAEFARDCAIGLNKENKEIMDELCATIYNEAEYIAYHDFREASLIMEQIALCSLLGHAQFMRVSWIDELMDFQTAVGCFNIERPDKDNTLVKAWGDEVEDWQFMRTKPSIWAGTCFTHITGSGMAVLVAAIRFIVETFHSS
ncbi:unnamed protein product [Arctia plantaginis]|uniref:Uncharacterized protein n=1 Tax=Arctia plantaginis TaxID=874455 RepID=A0A8S1B6D5_ARCPL|nr:unnamed protein product [Arctia plantaginis]